MPEGEKLRKFDESRDYVVDGALLNQITTLLEALRPLAEIESQTLDIFKGTSKVKIEVKGISGALGQGASLGTTTVEVCDGTTTRTITVLTLGS